MSRRFLASFGGGAAVLTVALFAAVVVGGQAASPEPNAKPQAAPAKKWTPPRTASGQPDLQGVWANNSATPLERPKELEGRSTLTDAEVVTMKERAARLFGPDGDAAFGDSVFQAALANPATFKSRDGETGDYKSVWMTDREFDNRTSLVTDPPDGRVPELTPEAKQRQAAAAALRLRRPDGPEDLTLQVRCITYGVPRLGGLAAGYNSYYQIVQSPGYVAITMEMIHDVRIIPLEGNPHIPQSIRQWHGDSRGRWDGDTLVVDTTNFSPKSSYSGSAGNLHMVERFTRVAPDTVNYEITLIDPTTWAKPWTALIRLKSSKDQIYEYACHEGNQSIVGILAGARAEEKAEQPAARRGSK